MLAMWLTQLTALISLAFLLATAKPGKQGLAWPNQLWVPMSGFTSPSSRISSYYTWTASPLIPSPAQLPRYTIPFPFIPMLWGCSDDQMSSFRSSLSSNFSNQNITSDKAILAFNEPDLGAQANCTPEKAAQVWRDVLQPLKRRGYRVGSPAVTNGPQGKEWLGKWFEACRGGCDPDFMTVHWYDVDPGRFMNYIKEYYTLYGRPIWVTEYAPTNFTFSSGGTNIGTQPTYSQVQRFMDVTSAWMDGTDYVERYFWFGAMYEMQGVTDHATLFELSGESARTGALNALGVQYTGAKGTVGNSSRTGVGAGPGTSSRPRWETGVASPVIDMIPTRYLLSILTLTMSIGIMPVYAL